jgi:hypothetical protein
MGELLDVGWKWRSFLLHMGLIVVVVFVLIVVGGYLVRG